MDEEPLYLRPRVDAALASLLRDGPFLHALCDALGSPLNVLLPEAVAENAARFQSVHRRHHLGGRVYFAHKTHRSSALVRRPAACDPAGVGIDVASLEELRHALSCGFTGDRVMATGPERAGSSSGSRPSPGGTRAHRRPRALLSSDLPRGAPPGGAGGWSPVRGPGVVVAGGRGGPRTGGLLRTPGAGPSPGRCRCRCRWSQPPSAGPPARRTAARQAGFRHVAPVWQVGDSCVLVAVKD